MDLALQFVSYLLSFNAVIVILILFWYRKVGRHIKIAVSFEEFLSSLPRNAKIIDPFILVDGKWVKTNQAYLLDSTGMSAGPCRHNQKDSNP